MLYTLITPFKKAGQDKLTYELELRDFMTAGDVLESRRNASNPSDHFETGLCLVARIAGLDKLDVHRMDMRDVDAIDAHIGVIRAPKESAAPSAT